MWWQCLKSGPSPAAAAVSYKASQRWLWLDRSSSLHPAAAKLAAAAEFWITSGNFLSCTPPTYKGWVQNVKLGPLVEINLARPMRSQDFWGSMNSILPHIYFYLQWVLMLSYWQQSKLPVLVKNKLTKFGIIDIRTVMEEQLINNNNSCSAEWRHKWFRENNISEVTKQS